MKKLLLAAALTLSFAPALGHAASLEGSALSADSSEFATLIAPKHKPRTRPARRIARGEGCTPEGAYIQWACGGRPAGSGWVQVDASCWHRDTGRRCY